MATEITAALVREVRDKTGAGLFDCKQSLIESDGNVEKALDWIRKKTGARPQRTKAATEGAVESYIHTSGKIGVIVEVNCETDFAARSVPFKTLIHDLALQIAASAPTYVKREDVVMDDLEHERHILKAQFEGKGKPDSIIEKILAGKLEKFYQEVCLLDKPFVKDGDKTIKTVIAEASAIIGETITVRRFTRYVMGEGLAKAQTNFAAEVAAAGGVVPPTPEPEPKAVEYLDIDLRRP